MGKLNERLPTPYNLRYKTGRCILALPNDNDKNLNTLKM